MTIEQLEVEELQYRLKRAKDNPLKYPDDFKLWVEFQLLKIEDFRKNGGM